MALSTAQKLQSLGVPTPLAIELGRQIDAKSYNLNRLIELGMTETLARVVSTQPFDRKKAVELGMIPAVAQFVYENTLPALFFILGPENDSNGRGAAEPSDQAAYVASYVVTPLNKVWSYTAQAYVNWVPGTMTGINGVIDDGGVGPECGFFRRANAKWPNRQILLFKDTLIGSFASRGPITQTFNGSISAGGALTVNTGTAPTTSKSLEGITVPLPSPTHTYTSATNVRTKPTNTYSGGAIASQDFTAHAIGLSWDLVMGALYTGWFFGASFAPGIKAKLDQCLAKMAADGLAYEYAGAMMSIFGNDGTDATTASRAQASLVSLLAQFRADYPAIAAKKICWTRPRNASPSGSVVRAAFTAITGSDAMLAPIETDDLVRWDAIHLTIAGLDTVGDRSFTALGL